MCAYVTLTDARVILRGTAQSVSLMNTHHTAVLMSLSEMIALLDNTENGRDLLLVLDAIAEVC